MTTQRDLDVAAKAALPICAECGWYAGYNHAERCNPVAGRAAASLIAAVPDVASGQLGYGDGCVVFDLSDNCSVLFERDRRGFSLRCVHLLDNLSVGEAATLVRAIKEWYDGRPGAKKGGRT